jgi:hypothetical protein
MNLWRKLDSDDRAALGMWATAHVSLLVLAWAAAWVFRTDTTHAPLTAAFEHWDAGLLRNIAQHGYWSGQSIKNNAAFFPGYPMVLAVAHLGLRNWTLSELVVSGVAGCYAVVSLARLARTCRAVIYLLTMSAVVFMMVGYTECLFLALAIPAWRAATRGRWWTVALLAGLAALIRPDGLFLIAALAVMALTRRQVLGAVKVLTSLAGPLAYEGYLTVHSGWQTFTKANQAGWDMHLVSPESALKTTWWAAFRHPFAASYSFEFQLELLAMAIMVLVTIAFLAYRMWPEAVYVGLCALTIGTQTWYQAGSRTLLILFPVCVVLSRVELRRRWVRSAYLAVALPLAVVLGLLFLSGQWAG